MEWSLPKVLLIVFISLMMIALIIKYINDSNYFIPKPKNMTPYEFIQERLDLAKASSSPTYDKDKQSSNSQTESNESDSKPITRISRDTDEKKKRHQEIINERHGGRLTTLENAVNYNLEEWRRKSQSKSIQNNMSKHNLKEGWCFIGKDRGFRSCLPVGRRDMCLSEHVYPTRDICIHPSLRFEP